MNGEKVQYLLCSSLYQKKGSSWWYTSNIWLNRLRNLNVGICNIGRILIYARCREMDKAYSFLTIKCMPNRRIDSVSINDRVVPSVSEIVVGRWTTRFLFLAQVFPQTVSGMMNSRIKSGKLSKSRSWVSRIELTFSTVMEVSVVSTEIGSFRGSADGGSASAESNAWDSSSTPEEADKSETWLNCWICSHQGRIAIL